MYVDKASQLEIQTNFNECVFVSLKQSCKVILTIGAFIEVQEVVWLMTLVYVSCLVH